MIVAPQLVVKFDDLRLAALKVVNNCLDIAFLVGPDSAGCHAADDQLAVEHHCPLVLKPAPPTIFGKSNQAGWLGCEGARRTGESDGQPED
jgi:hypothetical protein